MSARRFYFLGELGVFVQLALGAFERYFDAHPDARAEVLTYPDYGRILEHLFPGRVTAVPYDGPPLFAHRFGTGLAGDYPGEVDRIVAGFEDIRPLLVAAGHRRPFYLAKQRVPNEPALARALRLPVAWAWFRVPAADRPFFPVIPLRRPIRVEGEPGGIPTICVLPRFRKHRNSADRNIGAEFWNTLIGTHLKPAFAGRAKFVLCGLEAERVTGLDAADIVRPRDILDEIRLLNSAAALICPLSGYGQLGSFCGADVLYVLPPEPIDQENRHIVTVRETNAFGRRVDCLREPDILAHPDVLLDWIESAMPDRAETA